MRRTHGRRSRGTLSMRRLIRRLRGGHRCESSGEVRHRTAGHDPVVSRRSARPRRAAGRSGRSGSQPPPRRTSRAEPGAAQAFLRRSMARFESPSRWATRAMPRRRPPTSMDHRSRARAPRRRSLRRLSLAGLEQRFPSMASGHGRSDSQPEPGVRDSGRGGHAQIGPAGPDSSRARNDRA
jgi:hypothetical protein